jgi:apolipoprotein N-acyltransferase
LKFPGNFPARCVLAIVSGLCFALAFPPLDWGWLVFPGLAGLLVALQGQSAGRARLLGLLHGLAVFGTGLSWLLKIFGPVAFILWCVLAVFTVLFAQIQGSANLRGITGWKLALFTAINWGALEFIRAEIFPLKMPWMTAGLAIGPNVLLPWIGVYGVGVAVVFAATALTGRMWKSAAVTLAVLLAAVFLCRPYPSPDPGDEGVVSVAGLQHENVTIAALVDATGNLPDGIDHIVWPEYSVPFDVRANSREWENLLELCREKAITLTLGTQSRTQGGEDWRNIALTMDASGLLGEHTKNHTVHFFDDGIAGETALPTGTTHGKVGTPICFDCDYEGIVRKMTSSGAEYFVVPTMDAESWGSVQHDQHAELARIRAAENGRWIFVAATSGVSQLIDPNGHLHAQLGAMKQGWISGTLGRETRITPYTRGGWVFPWITLAGASALWLMLLIKPPPFRPDRSGVSPSDLGAVRLPIDKTGGLKTTTHITPRA